MGLPTPYQEYIHLSRYARYRYEDKRRETWDEACDLEKNLTRGE